MKYLMILVLSFITLVAYSEDFPIMLSIKSDTTIPDDFRDGVEEALTKMGYSLVDDKAQKEALKENAKARNSECYDDECLVDTGKMLAARALISVEVDKKGESAFKFKGRFIDFETGTTTKTKVMYYEAKLSDYKALSQFGKNFSNLLLGGKVKILETKKKDKVAIKKTVRKEIENPKEVKKQDYKPFPKKVTKKEVKKDAKPQVLLLKNKRYKGNWDITLSLIGGSHDFYTEYYMTFNDNGNSDFEKDNEGTFKGGGFGFGLTYRLNNLLGFYANAYLLATTGDISGSQMEIINNNPTLVELNASSYTIRRSWISLGTQFSFGDTKGTGLIYYLKTGLVFGTDNYIYDGESSNYDPGNDSTEVLGDLLDGTSISTLGIELEFGINISLTYNNAIDVYVALYYGEHLSGGLEEDTNIGTINIDNGNTVNALLGVRYNVYTF